MASASSEKFLFSEVNLLNSSPVLHMLRKSGQHSDIEIKVGDQVISAHRVILASVIPYFHKIISSANPENGRKIEIVMKEMNAEVIESLVSFCYTGKIEIERKNVGNLYICSNLFELNNIRDACVKFMTSNIQIDNVFKLNIFGESHKIDEIISATFKFICENFDQLSTSQKFLNLKPNQILEIIGRDDLKVSAKEEVYEAAIKWVKHHESKRSSFLPEILRKVQLASLPTEFIFDVVSKEDLIRQSMECRDILDEVKNIQMISMKTELLAKQINRKEPESTSMKMPLPSKQINNKKPAVNHKKEVIFAFCETKAGNNLMMKYQDNQWILVEHLARSYERVTFLNNKIYAFWNFGLDMDILDLQTNVWSKGKGLKGRSGYFRVASLNDCIYVCSSGTVSVECFSESENAWKRAAPLNHGRRYHGLVSLNGFIYAMGGMSLNSCERYCPTENKWTFVASMKTSRFDFEAVTLGGKIYVCGGSQDRSCEVYDPKTDSWSSIAPLRINFEGSFSLASCNGKLYAIGRYNVNVMPPEYSSVEVYCPKLNEWKCAKSLPKAFDHITLVAATI